MHFDLNIYTDIANFNLTFNVFHSMMHQVLRGHSVAGVHWDAMQKWVSAVCCVSCHCSGVG